MNSVEKYLRKNTKLYLSSLVYFIFFIYSDIYLIEPIIDIPEIIDSLIFFWFLYITCIVIMNLKDLNDKKGSL
tara:strand:- start:563 stop:781 length:219 start_codon:yes stop_codon:yes gene_type:complete